jgi:hypothetical protein
MAEHESETLAPIGHNAFPQYLRLFHPVHRDALNRFRTIPGEL